MKPWITPRWTWQQLPAFTAMTPAELTAMLGKGDVFVSQDLQSNTLFGDYRVDGAVMNVSGYNDFLARLTRRISQALSQPLPKGNKIAAHLANPYLQVNTADLTGALDDYIWTQLFGEPIQPDGRRKLARAAVAAGGRAHHQGVRDGADRVRSATNHRTN